MTKNQERAKKLENDAFQRRLQEKQNQMQQRLNELKQVRKSKLASIRKREQENKLLRESMNQMIYLDNYNQMSRKKRT